MALGYSCIRNGTTPAPTPMERDYIIGAIQDGIPLFYGYIVNGKYSGEYIIKDLGKEIKTESKKNKEEYFVFVGTNGQQVKTITIAKQRTIRGLT